MKALIFADTLFTAEKMAESRDKFDSLGIDYEFITDPIPLGMQQEGREFSEFIHLLETKGPEGWVQYPEEIMAKVEEADIIVTHFSGVTREMMERGRNLKLIYVMRSGSENVNIAAATELGIPVCNTPSRLAEAVSDMAVALMLAECRGITRTELHKTGGVWSGDPCRDASTASLANLTVGLFGFGGIAKLVAKKLIFGFGSRVMAYDPYCSAEEMAQHGVIAADLDTFLSSCDIVSIHARMCPETEGIFGKLEFSRMRPNAILINTARAGIVDEEALIEALQNHTIRSAAIDVYWQEPIPEDHPLLSLPNCTLTPHQSGATVDIVPNTIVLSVANLKQFVMGGETPTRLN